MGLHPIRAKGFTLIEDAANIRSGRLSLRNTYGSELLDLPVPFEAQYWTGSSYVRNAADSCTQVPVSTASAGLTFGGNLAAGKITLSINGTTSGNCSFSSGDGRLMLTKHGTGSDGYVDLTINAPAWLEFGWKGAGNADPTNRATFGIYKTSIICLRENF